jgi:hypothetical protein
MYVSMIGSNDNWPSAFFVVRRWVSPSLYFSLNRLLSKGKITLYTGR